MAEPPDVAWVGVDVGKGSHHVVAIDSDGKVLWSKQIRNDQSAIEGLISRAVETAHNLRWAADLTSAEAASCWHCWSPASRQLSMCPGGPSTG